MVADFQDGLRPVRWLRILGFPRWPWFVDGGMLLESMEVLGVDGNKVEKRGFRFF